MAYDNMYRNLQKENNDSKVGQYLKWKFEHTKYKRRPIEIKYRIVASVTRLTYHQVRSSFDRLVALGIIEKFVQSYPEKKGVFFKKNYYRLRYH